MPESTPVAVHHQIPMHNVEDWMYEDFQIGDKRRSIARTISEGEAMMFNAMVLDMHPYVADQPFAESDGNFGKRLVAGAQVFSYGLGLMANNNVHTFSYGYDELRFIKPVFIGDTIYTIRTHLSKRPKCESMGLVVVSYEIFKTSGDGVSGDLVLYAEHLQTVKYRDPSQWTDQIEK